MVAGRLGSRVVVNGVALAGSGAFDETPRDRRRSMAAPNDGGDPC